jgi:hypothetical protein
MVIKGKTEELLNNSRPVKRKCKNSPTPSNLRIMGIEEGEEGQANGMHNIFNKIITKFPKPRERYSHTDARGLQNTKRTRSK